jgi:hypothetical protein
MVKLQLRHLINGNFLDLTEVIWIGSPDSRIIKRDAVYKYIKTDFVGVTEGTDYHKIKIYIRNLSAAQIEEGAGIYELGDAIMRIEESNEIMWKQVKLNDWILQENTDGTFKMYVVKEIIDTGNIGDIMRYSLRRDD